MKKIANLLVCAFLAVTSLASCRNEEVQIYSISVDPAELSFGYEGGEETVSVTSTADWELSGDSFWCHASSYSGKGDAEVIFTADPNEDAEAGRSATFTFVSGDRKATLTVTQRKTEYSVSIEPKELKFNAEGGKQTVEVTSSHKWTLTNDSDWITTSADMGESGWSNVTLALNLLFIGDMGVDRSGYKQTRLDGKPLTAKAQTSLHLTAPHPIDPRLHSTIPEPNIDIGLVTVKYPTPNLGGYQTLIKYQKLSNLDKFYIYTDYAPRERGSWKYKQDNQPEVIVDFRLRPNGEYTPACRDRRYLMRGYAVCDDFYSPDYSRRPLPDTKDYRRTLLWMPDVKFDKEGKATVRLYNNSKPTAISIEAEGITRSGKPIVYQ